MKCFVTGATGFIGSNLVRELLARGHRVKALVRPESDRRALAGLNAELVAGDLGDRELLRREMDGCDWCFHTAASYHLWLPDYRPMYETNVEGTLNVIEAASHAGCQRIVYTSTVGCIGLPKEVNGQLVPSTETDLADFKDLANDYKRSKWEAEIIAAKFARTGRAGRHRESLRARRAGRFEADAHRPDHRGFFESKAAGVSGDGIELGSRARRRRRTHSGRGKGRGWRTLHFGQQPGQLDHETNPGFAPGNHRHSRAQNENSALGRAGRRAR